VTASAYFGFGLMMPARARVTIGWPAGAAVDAGTAGADGADGDPGAGDGEVGEA
jgi:hypothetical protein